MSYLLKYRQWKKLYEAANGEIPNDQLAQIPVPQDTSQSHKLNPIAAKAYSEMVSAAKNDGIVWGITDSYRNLETQKVLVKKKGLYSKGGLAAKPGTSNHGWGSAVDLKVKKGSDEHDWLVKNAERFGFSTIPREPWHWEHKASASLMKTGRMPKSDDVDIPQVQLGVTNLPLIFVGGLDDTSAGYKSIDEQTKLAKNGYGNTVISFRYNDNSQKIKEQIDKNVSSPIMLFSAACAKSEEIAKYLIEKNLPPSLLYIVEPYTPINNSKKGATQISIESAIKLGVPSKNVFRGPNESTGSNIDGGTDSSSLGRSSHWDAITKVAEFIKVSNISTLLNTFNQSKTNLSESDIEAIQISLVNAGYSLPVHGIDGKYGPETKKAIEEFQKDNGLQVTGQIDSPTYNMLTGEELPTRSIDSSKVTFGVSQISKDTLDYDTIVASVIDKLEGGYFHPNMRTRNPSKFGAYNRSGETMFGLDRHAGHSLYYSTPRKTKDVLSNLQHIESGEYQYKSQEAKEFWETIDSADAKNSWQWNYKGGPLEARLRYLAGRIIRPQFESLINQYLSPDSKNLVMQDGRLLFHFIYATWNGSGWFQKFASDINKAVAKGITNPDALVRVAMNSRTKEGLTQGSAPNPLIAQGGNKIEKIVGLA